MFAIFGKNYSLIKQTTIWIVLIQICIIVGILIYINKLEGVSSQQVTSMVPLAKEDHVFESAELKYFNEPKPNTYINHIQPIWSDETSYWHNELGARDLEEFSENRADAMTSTTYTIVLLGDSHTYGLYVPFEKTYGHILEEVLNGNMSCAEYTDFEVVNLAYTGYDAQYALERFKKSGAALEPELVVWKIGKDDLDQNSEHQNAFFVQYRNTHNTSVMNAVETTDVWMQGQRDLLDTVGVETVINNQLEKVEQLRNYQTKDILIFNTNPEFLLESEKQKLENVAQDAYTQLYFIDSNTFPDKSLFPDAHLNIVGHEFVGHMLFDYVAKNFLQECSVAE